MLDRDGRLSMHAAMLTPNITSNSKVLVTRITILVTNTITFNDAILQVSMSAMPTG